MNEKDLRRKSILNNMAIVSSPLRKGSGNEPITKNDTILNESNDEIERSKRRSNAEIQRRVSNIGADSSYRREAQRLFDRNEVNSHFQICMKLHSENKITIKNVWKLFITDILPQVVSSSPNVLQIAGVSLDISAKVYGLRVDSLHEEGIKLANVVSKFVEKSTTNNDNEENDMENGDDNNNQQKRQKKKKKILSNKPRSTILTNNSDSLFGDLPKLESVFFTIPEDSDISSTQNLFTNRLPMHPLGHKFLLLNNEIYWGDEPCSDIQTKYPMKLIKPNSFNICKPFTNFHINEWDPDEEDKQLEIERSQQATINDEVVVDENGIPIPNLDGSLHDIFANDDQIECDLNDDLDIHEPDAAGGLAHIEEFNRENLLATNDTYNTIINSNCVQVFNQLWAGPSHWKVKFIRPSKPQYTGSVISEQIIAKTNRKKVQSSLEPTDFFSDEPLNTLNKLIINKKRANVDINKITLCMPSLDLKDYYKRITELHNKPGLKPVKKSENGNFDYKVSDYNYDNPNDSQYCSQQVIDNNNDNDNSDDNINDGDDEIIDERVVEENQLFMGDNLVDAPESVPNSYIPYALKAKNIDMKKLKSTAWKILNDDASNRVGGGGYTDTFKISMPFSKLYETLPKHLNEKMNENLSVSQAFISTLFLCNEHNLLLKQDNSSDFLITKEE